MADNPSNPPPTIDELLVRGDQAEREASARFLEESRPDLVAGKQLAWDSFWRRLAGGIDSLLWNWLGGEVDVARAQEQDRASRKPRPKPGPTPPASE